MSASLRPVSRVDMRGVTVAPIGGTPPEVRWVDPRSLLVDSTYQRDLADRSITLIRKAAGSFDWRKFKMPDVAELEDGRLALIDGQHTAIAAVSRGDITEIPVAVKGRLGVEEQAQAFVSLNSERVNLTPMQLHFARVAGGDVQAIAIERVAKAAGARVLRNPAGRKAWKVGDTVSIAMIGKLIETRGEAGAIDVVRWCVEAYAAPITLSWLKAVDCLVYDAEFRLPGAVVSRELQRGGAQLAGEAAVYAAANELPTWRALAVVLAKRVRKAQGARAA